MSLACERSWVPTHGRVKPTTYKIDTCCSLARRSVLLGHDKDWMARGQDNVTEWDIISGHGAWFLSEAELLSHQECALSQVSTRGG